MPPTERNPKLSVNIWGNSVLMKMRRYRFKKCFKCSKHRDRKYFYAHSEMSDGLLGKCKKCTKKDVVVNRTKRIEYYREYDKKRSNLPHRISLRKRVLKDWEKLHKNGRKSHYKLNSSIRSGKIIKPKKCERCLVDRKLHAHHPDYRRPLFVKWFCVPCHKREHLDARKK